jgi:hypothetical protein
MGQLDELLDHVRQIKSIMIAVATGKRNIDDVETEYSQLRGKVGTRLAALKISDPNRFQSLWDWYGHWKSSGLGSYQSRREYVNNLYLPVIEAIEGLQKKERVGPATEPETTQPFSERHGYAPADRVPEITIRENAPEELRRAVVDIALRRGWDYDDLFDLAARIGKRPWESSEARESGVSSCVQLKRLIAGWQWYWMYDFIEAICAAMDGRLVFEEEADFEGILNDYLRHAGIGWQLSNGKIVTRGSEAFESSLHLAAATLKEAGLSTASEEIHEALLDLSRRPDPDLTGAVQHAMAALECTARSVSEDPRATLGEILKRHPNFIPKPLDIAVEKAWGYASEMGRHLQEAREPEREEVELVVGIAATLATFLAKKLPSG